MKFSICNEVFGQAQTLDDWKTICEYSHSVGYDGIEIAPFTFAENVNDISQRQRAEIKKIATDNGLEISGLHWLLVSPPGLHINAINEKLRAQTIDYLRALIDFAGDVGARAMIFGSPKARFVEDDLQSTWQRTLESYQQVLPALAARGVLLCQEALPAPECDFIQATKEAQQMVDDVNDTHFRLMLDTKSMSAEPQTPAELIRAFGKNCAHFHANDANRRAPGYGETDFTPIFEALKSVNYNGWISLEPFDYFPDPQTLARESLNYLKGCLNEN
jgi:sugar phosphate isomerase/epimerase